MSTDAETTPRYVVKPSQEMTGMRWPSHRYYVVDTSGQTEPLGQEHRVDAQERADRWNRNAAKETK